MVEHWGRRDYGPDHDPVAEAKAEVADWLNEWKRRLARSGQMAKEYCSMCTGEIIEDEHPSVDYVNPNGVTLRAHEDCARGMLSELRHVFSDDVDSDRT